MLWTAFVIGIMGSFHCVGMCGPLVLALPGQSRIIPMRFLYTRLLYNAGRIITYSLMGLFIGLIGQTFSIAGYQQFLSILAGITLLVLVFVPLADGRQMGSTGKFGRLSAKIRSTLSSLFKKTGANTHLFIGLLNGLLPCGLVYLALAGSIAMGSVSGSMTYMALFGLGTVPMLLAVAFAGNMISLQWRSRLYKLIPAFMFILAVLFILRGLNLGIPYISPELQGKSVVDPVICH
ncbi:MAG: sulfite exporter TauE/SafE family protein [Cyclobacteriaceae bacterium]|nr:sulfite exporter TauE/SafE family protein [Cyclobacteriaceae bacterium]